MAQAKHSTQILPLSLLALATCVVAGCWEEIHYTPPPGGESRPTRTRTVAKTEVAPVEVTPDHSAANFADDLASSFPTDPTESPTPGEPASAGGEEPPRYADTTPIPADEPPQGLEEDFLVDPEPSSPSPPPPPDPASNTRRVAWLLGSKLSLAALANERGGDPAEVQKWFAQSQMLAKLLGTTVEPLPAPSATASGNGVDYVFAQGQRIGRDVATTYADDHAALFELAVKSYVLLALYQPHAPVAEALADAVDKAGQRAGLPAQLFVPFTRAVTAGEPASVVRDAVLQLNQAIDDRLNAPSN
jgi:hypothetical protein